MPQASATATQARRDRRPDLCRGRSCRPVDQERADRQRVRPGSQKDVHRLGRRAHQRLAVDVEAGVEHGADAPALARLRAAARRTRRCRRRRRSAGGRCRRRSSRRPAGSGGPRPPDTPWSWTGCGRRSQSASRRARLALEHARAERLIPHAPLEHEIEAIAQVGRSGRASTLRWPSARGPYSIAPWNHITIRPSASSDGDACRQVRRPARRAGRRPAALASMSGASKPGPRSRRSRSSRTGSPAPAAASTAAPSASPPSPMCGNT